MNRARVIIPVLLLCLVAIVLPWFIAQLTYDEIGAEMGVDGWLTLWRGFPFHFVTPIEFCDEFRVASPSYLGDCAFWLIVLLCFRHRFRVRRYAGSRKNARTNSRNV